jgi:predicted nucleic acid-binding protein
MRELAVCLEDLPIIASSPDPDDNVLLAIAQAGMADLLVTGDKRDLLSLVRHGQTRIVTARAALEMLAD